MTAGRYIGRVITFLALSLVAVPAWIGALLAILFTNEQGSVAGRALDQFNNAALFGGSNYETISSHIGRLQSVGNTPRWARLVGQLLDTIDPGHCARAADDEAPILAAIDKASAVTEPRAEP